MIYRSMIIASAQQLFAPLLVQEAGSVQEHLSQLAELLWQGLRSLHPAAVNLAANWFPDTIGASKETISSREWRLADAQLIIAREHGYIDFTDITGYYDPIFERFINLLLAGEFAPVKSLLKEYPHIVHTRSSYGHRATALHYLAANGVETRRQQVPLQLVELIKLLLQHGADPKATMYVYHQDCTPLDLLVTSAHPYAAGLGEQAAQVLSEAI
ncbi:MAG: hypothetical protein AAF828_10365 [Bacteroidota bacterium]